MSNIKSFRTQAGVSAYAADTYTITSVPQSIDLDTVSLSVAVRLYRGLLYEKITTGTQDQLALQFLATKINVDGGGAGVGAGGIVSIEGKGDGNSLVHSIDTGVAYLKNVKAGTNVSVVDDGQNLVISSTGGVANVPIEIIANIGPTAGAGIYKGLSGKTAQLRKITAGNNVTVVQNADEIVVSAVIPPIPSQGITSGQNIGSGYGIFKEVHNSNTARFKSIVAGNNISITSGENELILNAVIPTITPATVTDLMSATGTGVPVFKELTSTIGYFRKIKAGNNATVSLDGDDIVVGAVIPSPTGVETIINIGDTSGYGIFKQTSGNQAQFLRIKEGNNVSISSENDTITISAVPGEGATFAEGANVGTGEGAIYKNTLGSNLQFRTIKAGENIAITQEADQIVISAIEGGETTIANVISGATAGAESVINSSDNGIVELKGIKAGSNTTITTNGSDIVISSNPGVTSGSNSGIGEGQVFKQINSNQVVLKSIKAGENITITDNGDEIIIDAETGSAIALDSLESVGTSGAANITAGVNGSSAKFKGVKAGANVTVTENATDVTISASFDAMQSGQNDGDGAGKIFKSVDSGVGKFRSIKAGTNISITQDADNITINSVGGDEAPAVGNVVNIGNASNAKVGAGINGADLQLRTLKAGQNITITEGADEIVIGSNMDLSGAVTNVQNKATAQSYDASLVSGVDAGVASIRRLVAGENVTITEGADVITITAAAAGEGAVDTFTNIGDGSGKVYESTNGTNHNLRSIKAGTNVTISQDAENIYINSTASGGAPDIIQNVGTGEGSVFKSSVGSTHSMRKIKAGSNVTITESGDDIVIASTASGGGSGGSGLSIGDFDNLATYAIKDFCIVGNTLYRAKEVNGPGEFDPNKWEKIGDGSGDVVIPVDELGSISGFYGPYGVTETDPVITYTFLKNETANSQLVIGDRKFAILPFARLYESPSTFTNINTANSLYECVTKINNPNDYSASRIFEIDITDEPGDQNRYIQIAFVSESEFVDKGALDISSEYLNIAISDIGSLATGFSECAFIRIGKNEFNKPLAYGRFMGTFSNAAGDSYEFNNPYNELFNGANYNLSFAEPKDPIDNNTNINGWIGVNDPIKKLIVQVNRKSGNLRHQFADELADYELYISIYGLVEGTTEQSLIKIANFEIMSMLSQTIPAYDNGSDKYGNLDHILIGSVGYEINVNSSPVFTEGEEIDYWLTQEGLLFLEYVGESNVSSNVLIDDKFGTHYEINGSTVYYEKIISDNIGNGFGVTFYQENNNEGVELDIDGNWIDPQLTEVPDLPFFHGCPIFNAVNKNSGISSENAIELTMRGPSSLPEWAKSVEFEDGIVYKSKVNGIFYVNATQNQSIWLKIKRADLKAHALYFDIWAADILASDVRFDNGSGPSISEVDSANVYLAKSSIGFELANLVSVNTLGELVEKSNGVGTLADLEYINIINYVNNEDYDYVIIEYIPNAAYLAALDYQKSVTMSFEVEFGYPTNAGIISFDPPPEAYTPPTLPTTGDYFYELTLGDSYGDGWEGSPGHYVVLNIDGTDYRLTLLNAGLESQQQNESHYFAAMSNSIVTLTFEKNADAYPDECSVNLIQIPADGNIVEADFSGGLNVYNIVNMENVNGELISFAAPYA